MLLIPFFTMIRAFSGVLVQETCIIFYLLTPMAWCCLTGFESSAWCFSLKVLPEPGWKFLKQSMSHIFITAEYPGLHWLWNSQNAFCCQSLRVKSRPSAECSAFVPQTVLMIHSSFIDTPSKSWTFTLEYICMLKPGEIFCLLKPWPLLAMENKLTRTKELVGSSGWESQRAHCTGNEIPALSWKSLRSVSFHVQ